MEGNMRRLIVGTGLFCMVAEVALAAPGRFQTFEQIRFECNQNRCLDTRSGAYTASTCDWNGCRPSSGVVGYTDPRTSPQHPRYEGYGYRRGPEYRRGYGYPPPPPPGYGYAPGYGDQDD